MVCSMDMRGNLTMKRSLQGRLHGHYFQSRSGVVSFRSLLKKEYKKGAVTPSLVDSISWKKALQNIKEP